MGEFSPIALANFQFKIVTKILADTLAIITMCIISQEQRGFIHNRNISKRQFGGNVALKVDIKKAFNTFMEN